MGRFLRDQGVEGAVDQQEATQSVDLTVAPPLVLVTSLGSDHLDWHGTLAQYHDDCARLTYHQGGNRSLHGPRSFVDQGAYLRCVVLGVDGWVEENRVRKEAERVRATEIPGH